MSGSITITCKIDTTDATVPLGFEAWIDDELAFATDHVTGAQTLSMDVADDEALHQLRFVLKNKDSAHTTLDAAGNIVTDACVTVQDVCFDSIPLRQVFFDKATYSHDFNGTADPVQDRFYGIMGCNGTVELKFTTPIYLWLLEHM
jgi:hypothetical protein